MFTFNRACPKDHPSAADVGSVHGCSTYLSRETTNHDTKAKAYNMNINEALQALLSNPPGASSRLNKLIFMSKPSCMRIGKESSALL